MSLSNILEVKNLSFAYSEKEPILENVEFFIKEREFVSIIGPNGGGKSTLIKLILGELKPKSGEIKVFNKNPKDVIHKIGYVPQNTNININFPIRVIDVVMMGNLNQHFKFRNLIDRLTPFRYSEGEKRCTFTTLEKVGMEKYIYKHIGALSGGERQRVMIARALCSHPEILILDEPTSSIDIEGQKRIYSLLKELNSEMTIVVVTMMLMQ